MFARRGVTSPRGMNRQSACIDRITRRQRAERHDQAEICIVLLWLFFFLYISRFYVSRAKLAVTASDCKLRDRRNRERIL
jgi:hypothetical protein